MKIVTNTRDSLVDQLLREKADQSRWGYLIGTRNIIFNFCQFPLPVGNSSCVEYEESVIDDAISFIRSSLPIGLDIIGLFMTRDLFRLSDQSQYPAKIDFGAKNEPPFTIDPKLWSKDEKWRQCLIIGDHDRELRYYQEGSLQSATSLETLQHVQYLTRSSAIQDESKDSFVLVNCSTSVEISINRQQPPRLSLDRSLVVNQWNHEPLLGTSSILEHLKVNCSDEKKNSVDANYSATTRQKKKHIANKKNRPSSSSSVVSGSGDDKSFGGEISFIPPAPRETMIKFKLTVSHSDRNNQDNRELKMTVDQRDVICHCTVPCTLYSSSSLLDNDLQPSQVSISNESNTVSVLLNVFGYIDPGISLSELNQAIVDKLNAQLHMVHTLLSHNEKSTDNNRTPKHIYFVHHLPSYSYPHVITTRCTFYSDSISDEQTTPMSISERSLYHTMYFLPPNAPVLRFGKALPFGRDDTSSHSGLQSSRSPKLSNVHLFVKPLPTVANNATTKLVTVKGSYTYYHYLQDGFQDDGWGCAYRSCQTLISYLKMNNLSCTSSPVPGIPEMQEILVHLGDKQKSFLNSRQWIGAMENTYIIGQVCNIECKVLYVSNKKDLMENHLRALVRHFDDHGTPVMIGGGVLAYTLLGIQYDEVNTIENTRFLILDPHYRGSDTVFYGGEESDSKPTNTRNQYNAHLNTNTASGLEVIIRDGWCGWKRADQIFLENTFYNFCMPQAPNAL